MERHQEPCNNQECREKLKFLLYRTSMCPKLSDCRQYRQNCTYAHSTDELRPMPKWEMCERNNNGMCWFYNEPEKVSAWQVLLCV